MDAIDRGSWDGLFVDSGSAPQSRAFSALARNGRPFLLLPKQPAVAAQALELYAAQTSLARLLRSGCRLALQWKLPLPTATHRLPFAPDSALGAFVRGLAGTPDFPEIAILAGNPNAAGRRFIVLVFGADGRPAAVVKVGLDRESIALIERERDFLRSVPPGRVGVPALIGECVTERVCAFALPFFENGIDGRDAETLLSGWIDENCTTPLSGIPAWQRLHERAADEPGFLRLAEALGARIVHPALMHGDFAPWNLRAGGTIALDWERGELVGVPAWDWFHLTVQPAILVEHATPSAVLTRVRRLIASPAFASYATRARIGGIEREWFVAYLFHCLSVLRPTEGADATRQLLKLSLESWPGV